MSAARLSPRCAATIVVSNRKRELPTFPMWANGLMAHGFPVVARFAKIPTAGTIHIALLPVDFPDYAGESNVQEELQHTITTMTNWFDYFSGGKLHVDFVTTENWVRAPAASTTFDDQTGYPGVPWWESAKLITQRFVDLAPETFDFRQIGAMFVMLPYKMHTFNDDLTPSSWPMETKQGTQVVKVNVMPAVLNDQLQEYWAWCVHELLHDVGLAGHAPGAGYPLNLMTNQNGASYSLSAYDQFIAEWLPAEQVYCVAPESAHNQTIALSPMEREEAFTKMVLIPLSDHEALVVEAHGVSDWSSTNPMHKPPSGMHGVVVYRVNTQCGNDRTHEGFFGTTVPEGSSVTPAGAQPLDNGNDPTYPKFAYFLQTNGGIASAYTGWGTDQARLKVLSHSIGFEGDSFTSDGITIKVVASGDYETVQISRAA